MNRTISMSNKYFGGVVSDKGVCADVDADLKAVACTALAKVSAKMEKPACGGCDFRNFVLFKRCNKYIDETEPRILAKDEAKRIVLPQCCTIWWKAL